MQRWGQGLPRLELSHGAPNALGPAAGGKRARPVCPSRNMPLLVQLSGSSGRQLCLLLFRWERMTDRGPTGLAKGPQLKSVSWHCGVGRGRSLKLERRESEPFLGGQTQAGEPHPGELRKPLGGKCSSAQLILSFPNCFEPLNLWFLCCVAVLSALPNFRCLVV